MRVGQPARHLAPDVGHDGRIQVGLAAEADRQHAAGGGGADFGIGGEGQAARINCVPIPRPRKGSGTSVCIRRMLCGVR